MPADHAPASAGLKLRLSLLREVADVLLKPPRPAAEPGESIPSELQRGRVAQPGLARAQAATQLEYLARQREADAPRVHRSDVIEAESLRIDDLLPVPATVIAGEYDLPGGHGVTGSNVTVSGSNTRAPLPAG
jgi:hypothetical protein